MVLNDDWHLRKEKPVPERTEVPMAFGVNGPYLWREATEGPKVSDDDRRSKEAEKPLPEPAEPPIAFGVDWQDIWKQGTERPTDGGESPSR
jgi:hypothetical protein